MKTLELTLNFLIFFLVTPFLRDNFFCFFFCNLISDNGTIDFKALSIAWNVSVFAVILVRIFPQSDWIRRDTLYLSVFSPNAGKYGPESLRIGTLFTQWLILNNFQQVEDSENFNVFNFLWSFVIFFESTLITCQLQPFTMMITKRW